MFAGERIKIEDIQDLTDKNVADLVSSRAKLKLFTSERKKLGDVWDYLFDKREIVSREEALRKFRYLMGNFNIFDLKIGFDIDKRIDNSVSGENTRKFIVSHILADALVSWLDRGDGRISKENFLTLLGKIKLGPVPTIKTRSPNTYEPAKMAEELYKIMNIPGFVNAYATPFTKKYLEESEYAVRKSTKYLLAIEFKKNNTLETLSVELRKDGYFALLEIGEQKDPAVLVEKLLEDRKKKTNCDYVPYRSK